MFEFKRSSLTCSAIWGRQFEGDTVTEWLERCTCNKEVPSLSLALTSSLICFQHPCVLILAHVCKIDNWFAFHHFGFLSLFSSIWIICFIIPDKPLWREDNYVFKFRSPSKEKLSSSLFNLYCSQRHLSSILGFACRCLIKRCKFKLEFWSWKFLLQAML